VNWPPAQAAPVLQSAPAADPVTTSYTDAKFESFTLKRPRRG
jgi:hypothetical protein